MPRNVYLVASRDGRLYPARSLREALEKAMELEPPVRIYRGVLVAELDRDEIEELKSVLMASERRVVVSEEGRREKNRDATLAIVVFDQMFRGFGDIVGRELGRVIEVHEVAGRGVEKPVKMGHVILDPAHDDYDIMKLLDRLRSRGCPVIFFTGDKKLAQQASTLDGVFVEYLPPSEIPGKEIAIRMMLERIREILKEVWA
ncbi:hypothetical protein [Pyrolobus fumarii]|uniref:hypothetical protein n=1 Tax=Pyrolobus fumarii TaxID=54252 RepID=UPI001432C342|nr:hypothetical protein [Pyrolobus fumarii]